MRFHQKLAGLLAGSFLATAVNADQPEPPATEPEFSQTTYNWILDIEAAGIGVNNNFFGNDEGYFGRHTDGWYESALTFGGEAFWKTQNSGEVFADLAGLVIASGGYDAGISNPDNEYVNRLELYQAAIGWQSGDLLDLGEDALRLSAGRQRFTLGSGFLIWKGGSGGGRRGDTWLGPHQTWYNSGVMDLDIGQSIELNAFYLSPNDFPYSDTHLYGVNGDFSVPHDVDLGVSFIEIFDSNDADRRHTRSYDFRYEYQRDATEGLNIRAEWVFQERPSIRENKEAWYAEAAWLFDGALPTRLSYRFANFDEGYDPLFPGSSEWGAWFQGEYLGEYLLRNENLQSHQARLVLKPSEKWTFNAIYYFFLVNRLNQGQFSAPAETMTDDRLAQEFDFIADYQITEQVKMSFIALFVVPERGGEQWSGGDDLISYGLVYLNYSY